MENSMQKQNRTWNERDLTSLIEFLNFNVQYATHRTIVYCNLPILEVVGVEEQRSF